MANRYSTIIICNLFLLIISCSNEEYIKNHFVIDRKYIINYDLKNQEVLSLIKYYYSPLYMNDSTIIVSVAYAWEIKVKSLDTIRILCFNCPNKFPTPGIILFSNTKRKIPMDIKIFVKDDSTLSKRPFKTVIGNIIFQDE